jgi:NADH-quinone oxidoreductase subunit K
VTTVAALAVLLRLLLNLYRPQVLTRHSTHLLFDFTPLSVTFMNKPYFDIITVPYSLELQYFDKFTYLSPTPLETSTPAWLTVSFCLFFIGLAGMAFNYKNFLVTMMCVEIMYLGAVTSFVFYGLAFHDITAAIYGLLILIFAACESAVGLGLLISVYRFGRTIGFSALISLGG